MSSIWVLYLFFSLGGVLLRLFGLSPARRFDLASSPQAATTRLKWPLIASSTSPWAVPIARVWRRMWPRGDARPTWWHDATRQLAGKKHRRFRTSHNYSDITWYHYWKRFEAREWWEWCLFWIECFVWGKLAENLKNHCTKLFFFHHQRFIKRVGKGCQFTDISTLLMVGEVVSSRQRLQGQHITMLESKHEETEKLALQKALQHGVFAREDSLRFHFFWGGVRGLDLKWWRFGNHIGFRSELRKFLNSRYETINNILNISWTKHILWNRRFFPAFNFRFFCSRKARARNHEETMVSQFHEGLMMAVFKPYSSNDRRSHRRHHHHQW